MAPRTRVRVGVVLLVLAGLLLPVVVLATWTARTVTDTSAFVERVAPAASAPEVQALVEDQITGQVTAAIDTGVAPLVSGGIDELAAPEPVKGLLRDVAASLGGAVEARVAGVVERVVEAPEFQEAFTGAVETAHGELVSTLEGEAGETALVSDGRTVSIRLATVGNAVRAELVGAGFSFVERLPTLEASVPIATVEQLEQWQRYYQVLTVLVWLGPLLLLLLAAVGTWLRGDLAASGLWFAGTGLLALVAVVVAVRVAVASAASTLEDPLAADAARAVVDTVTETLARNATVTGVVLVVLLAASAWFAARRRLASVSPTA